MRPNVPGAESSEANLFDRDEERGQERAEEEKVRSGDELERKRRCAVGNGDRAVLVHATSLEGNRAETVNGLAKTLMQFQDKRGRLSVGNCG